MNTQLIEEQLQRTLKALAKARSVREVKALQDRVRFLRKLLERCKA